MKPALFPGLPHETVPPAGTTRALTTGGLKYFGWNEPTGAGYYETLVTDTAVSTLNWNSAGAYLAGENANGVSRVLLGAILAPTTGLYSFSVIGVDGWRVYFQGQKVVDSPAQSTASTTYTWSATLTSGPWKW